MDLKRRVERPSYNMALQSAGVKVCSEVDEEGNTVSEYYRPERDQAEVAPS